MKLTVLKVLSLLVFLGGVLVLGLIIESGSEEAGFFTRNYEQFKTAVSTEGGEAAQSSLKVFGFISGLLMILLGLYGFVPRLPGRRDSFTYQGAAGEVTMQLEAVERSLQRVIAKMSEVKKVRVRLTPDAGGTVVEVRVQAILVKPEGLSARATTERVHRFIEHTAKDLLGLEELAPIALSAGFAVNAQASERSLRQQVEREERAVPAPAAEAVETAPAEAVPVEEITPPEPTPAAEVEETVYEAAEEIQVEEEPAPPAEEQPIAESPAEPGGAGLTDEESAAAPEAGPPEETAGTYGGAEVSEEAIAEAPEAEPAEEAPLDTPDSVEDAPVEAGEKPQELPLAAFVDDVVDRPLSEEPDAEDLTRADDTPIEEDSAGLGALEEAMEAGGETALPEIPGALEDASDGETDDTNAADEKDQNPPPPYKG